MLMCQLNTLSDGDAIDAIPLPLLWSQEARSFQSKMHQKPSGGRAPPGPAGGAWALPRPPSRIRGWDETQEVKLPFSPLNPKLKLRPCCERRSVAVLAALCTSLSSVCTEILRNIDNDSSTTLDRLVRQYCVTWLHFHNWRPGQHSVFCTVFNYYYWFYQNLAIANRSRVSCINTNNNTLHNITLPWNLV